MANHKKILIPQIPLPRVEFKTETVTYRIGDRVVIQRRATHSTRLATADDKEWLRENTGLTKQESPPATATAARGKAARNLVSAHDLVETAVRLRRSGASQAAIARQLGMGVEALRRRLVRFCLPTTTVYGEPSWDPERALALHRARVSAEVIAMVYQVPLAQVIALTDPDDDERGHVEELLWS